MKTLIGVLRAPKTEGDDGGGTGAGAPVGESMYGKGTVIPDKESLGTGPEDGDDEPVGSDEPEGEDTDFADADKPEGEDLGGDDSEGADKPEAEKPQPFLRIAPEDLAAIRGNADKGQPGAAEPKLTDAQVKQLVNPVEVTADLVAAIRSDDPAVATKALQGFAEATVKNAVSLARLMIQRKEKEIEARLGPITEQHQQAKLQETKASFYGQYKDLAKYDIIVKAAAEEVSPTDANGREKSREQIFKEVAGLTKKKLVALGLNIQQPNANHSVGAGKSVPGANKFSSSGRSGGDQHSGKGKANNPDAEIYAR
jgi:hypothetical protein